MIHYGASCTACGNLNADDTVTEVISDIECEECVAVINYCPCDICN